MYKEGDKVRVRNNLTGHHYEIGSIVTIKYVCDYGNGINYDCLEEVDGWGWNVTEDEVELVTFKKPTPDHYKTNSIDVIDFVKLYDLNFNLGNVVKYVCRNKGTDLEDYKKAIDYLQREIKHLESLDN